MAIVYLTEQQAWVGREGDCLIVHIPEQSADGSKTKRERKMTVPLFKVEEVMVMGDITITTPALASLLEAKVSVTYLSKYGRYLGSLNPLLTKNSILRLAQHAAHSDSKRRHVVAQRFVLGKLRNMRTVLMRYNRNQSDSLLSSQIDCWAHGFSKRVRRPPTDPVNAMLSYGYVILSSQVASAVAGVGFDPYIGYLHSSRYGKPALALDLMEEFRPLIVDSVVLSLLNNRQLEQKDFEQELNSYRMTDAAKRLFLEKFEERMQEVITHPVFEYKVPYRRCIELQARLLGKYFTGEVNEYTPFTVR